MPRPLIVKVEDSMNHLHEPSKITNLSKVFSKSLTKVGDEPFVNGMVNTKSFVRNLINLYEDPHISKSNLIKSKSLPYIAQSKPLAITAPETSMKDKKVPEISSNSNKGKFDFQTVWRKFETSTSSEVQKTRVVKTTKQEVSDFGTLRNKAQALLDIYGSVADSTWKVQVLSFLKNICSASGNVTLNTNESRTHTAETKKEVHNSEHQHTVQERTNFWERQNSANPMTPKSFEHYFTGVNAHNDDNKYDDENNNIDSDSSSNESTVSDSEHSQIGPDVHENSSPGMKIFELKSYFESKKDKNTEKTEVIENTIETNNIDSDEDSDEIEDEVESIYPREIIRSLMKEIEHYKEEIESISMEDIDRGGEINEELVKILIKLDDVFTQNKEALAERKQAIAFVQECIRMLRLKMRN
ncbi:hypothetical protein FQR65_LT06439 [Abscondita terminalis]|nr:hypothetical protein FQR65_LT06439 [Abscondita terminalis]